MSDQAEGKKKLGKLPIVIVLTLVLGAGGFFGMKARDGGGSQEKPPAALGEIQQLEEFLVNLSDPNAYVRTDIAFHMVKDYDIAKLGFYMAPIRDAINLKLKATTLAQVSKPEGMMRLKREMAETVNRVLLEAEANEAAGKGKAKPKEEEKSSEPGDDGKRAETEPKKIPEGWDSAEGPVLKIYFVSFATQ
jgi:flagellar basal body-associated protein FliL